ncbi:hypothetical protein G7K_1928-t1 [Saitoella complicata NRRL Y-17804]|uniref:Uncharacterized protein n=1 Tax=Saitoella complicata (strain BCRC 22490 / CBS 7301 / JCM 7358 / NBRC 10748 / NRRL Y-17804) TaxID=698492 RepID=A0A0E9ND15_SAICN|nr:hypothetical protein G7K_1928-t1 [Saitoella complicata NRRL Y-17804]
MDQSLPTIDRRRPRQLGGPRQYTHAGCYIYIYMYLIAGGVVTSHALIAAGALFACAQNPRDDVKPRGKTRNIVRREKRDVGL